MNVILIGDSIRMGYQPLVAERLAGRADIRELKENGGTSSNVLAHLDEWALSEPAEILHLNCGLHDLAIEPGGGNRVPIEEFTKNLGAIVDRISGEFAGRSIWATTTPVIDEWHHKVKPFDRHESDVLRYNEAALAIMAEAGIEVNDLHGVIHRAGPEQCLGPDGVHMNERGNELLAEAVAGAIMSVAN